MGFFVYVNSHFGAYWSLTPLPDATPDEFSVPSVSVQTNRVPGTYYWYVEHILSSDADFEYLPPSNALRSTFTISSSGLGLNTGIITLPALTADGTTEGPESFRVHVAESATGDAVANTLLTIQDTSIEAFYVDAGLDQVLLGGANVANLNGFYSGNVNNVTVDWIQVAGDTVIIGNVNAVQSNFTMPPGAGGFITMRLYINYGLTGQLYDDVNYFLTPLDNMSVLVGARLASGPESLTYTVDPRVEV